MNLQVAMNTPSTILCIAACLKGHTERAEELVWTHNTNHATTSTLYLQFQPDRLAVMVLGTPPPGFASVEQIGILQQKGYRLLSHVILFQKCWEKERDYETCLTTTGLGILLT
jgi:hypothetical protein